MVLSTREVIVEYTLGNLRQLGNDYRAAAYEEVMERLEEIENDGGVGVWGRMGGCLVGSAWGTLFG